ncbi:hypothetical protein GCM10010435_24080 [Winogradskya consettensis]
MRGQPVDTVGEADGGTYVAYPVVGGEAGDRLAGEIADDGYARRLVRDPLGDPAERLQHRIHVRGVERVRHP